MSEWIKVCAVEDIGNNNGGCVKVEGQHIAIFNYKDGEEWYAVQNICPHKQESVLSRGLLGEEQEEAKVACPLHKNSFFLKTGKHVGGDESYQLTTYPIKIEGSDVFIQLNTERNES